MKQEQLENNILSTLSTLTWDIRESELRAAHKGLVLYVNDNGRVQVWKGAQMVMEFVSPVAKEFHAERYSRIKPEQLEEIAQAFPLRDDDEDAVSQGAKADSSHDLS